MTTRFSQKELDLVRKSGLFDSDWYREEYSDVTLLHMDPLEHFMWLGWRLHRSPGPQFDAKAYLKRHPDVRLAHVNPLIHHLSGGRSQPAFTTRPGTVRRIAGQPVVLLCAHAAGNELFGGERSFIDMVGALSQLSLNLYVTLPSLENAEYVEDIERKVSGVIKVPKHSWRHRADVRALEALFELIIRELRVDLVYTNTITLRAPQIAARNCGIKTICHVREIISHDAHLADRIALDPDCIIEDVIRRSDAIICNSRTTAAVFDTPNLFEIANVVDPAQLDLPNPVDGPVRFGIISSNLPKKGVQDFVEIARICEARSIPVEFLVIGPENEFIARLRNEGLPDNLCLAGYAPTPVEALRQINVLLSLSHFQESFGRTVAEALAARRPVIAYDWGAVRELVQNGESGFLVPHLDRMAVVDCIAQISAEPELIGALGETGRSWVQEHIAPEIYKAKLQNCLSGFIGPISPKASVDSSGGTMVDKEFAGRALANLSHPSRVTIIVPVYNAPDDVAVCLDSLRRWTDLNRHRVLVIDDGSPDPRVPPVLKRFTDCPGFSILSNDENLGYTRTINKGIRWAGQDDIVLLNSDTMVSARWLDGMLETAATGDDVGTVTAMSDNAGAFSFPVAQQQNMPAPGYSREAWAQAVIRQTHRCAPVEVPTGNGFCLFIRRKLFEQIGYFDADKFPRGYGEENEFCMRALHQGWKHLITPLSYVYHERSKSFGDAKSKLAAEGAAVVNADFPSYMVKVRDAFRSEAMLALRNAAAGTFRALERERIAATAMQLELAAKGQKLVDWDSLASDLVARKAGRTSIIICAYNNAGITRKCLASLLDGAIGEDDEIILVDNGSDPESFAPVAEFARNHGRIRFIENGENLNFAIGNNIGFAASTGEHVVFLNNDTEVHKGWLPPLIEELADPHVLGTQPRLTFPDGNIQCAGVVFSGRSPLGYSLYSDIPGDSPLGLKKRYLRAVTAACIAMRARDYAAVRGFDPIYINGQEDVDLCLRLGRGEARFLYVPQSRVTHHEGKTAGRGKHVLANRRVFVARWQGKYDRDDHICYAADDMHAQDYVFDNEELTAEGIELWRPRSLTPLT